MTHINSTGVNPPHLCLHQVVALDVFNTHRWQRHLANCLRMQVAVTPNTFKLETIRSGKNNAWPLWNQYSQALRTRQALGPFWPAISRASRARGPAERPVAPRANGWEMPGNPPKHILGARKCATTGKKFQRVARQVSENRNDAPPIWPPPSALKIRPDRSEGVLLSPACLRNSFCRSTRLLTSACT